MFDLDLALRFGVALGLGLLLGLERERKRDAEMLFGGVRTFALIALLGAIGAFMQRELNQGWLVIAAFVSLSALVIVSYATTAARGELGITTEVTALLAFTVGALCGWEKVGVASVVTVVCLLLLTFKDFLHRLARRVELADVEATLQFAVISVIILPLLPNQNFGPPPLDVIGCMAAAGLLISFFLWQRSKARETGTVSARANPFELSEAIKSGFLFGFVTVVAKAAETYFGATGLYLAGALAGLTDVDAISLSMANLATMNPESLLIAARTIVIAVVANTLVKAVMAAFMGAPALRRTVSLATILLLIAAGGGILVA